METNFLIIGSGAAGLTLAVKLAAEFPKKKITVVTKAHQAESNTKYAQGGVAAVFDLKEDSFQKHIEDTLLAGDGRMCNLVAYRVAGEFYFIFWKEALHVVVTHTNSLRFSPQYFIALTSV